MVADAIVSGDAINTGVWLGEFTGDRALTFGARPKQDIAGVATLVALWDEPPVFVSDRYLARLCSDEQTGSIRGKCNGPHMRINPESPPPQSASS